MKIKAFIPVLSVLFLYSCGNSSASHVTDKAVTSSAKKTTIQWIDSARNFGRMNEGEKLALEFRFRNAGDQPLIIESVRPSCGCTIADFPKEPVPPGGEGEITGVFDSHSKEGHQHKELTVKANTAGNGEETISFDVEVIHKPGTPESE